MNKTQRAIVYVHFISKIIPIIWYIGLSYEM
jgi:hypothetical protein